MLPCSLCVCTDLIFLPSRPLASPKKNSFCFLSKYICRKAVPTIGRMEEDVEPKDEDGVDGRRFYGWDGWVGGLGAVGASSIFGLVRRAGAFAAVLSTFVLVSRMQLTQQYRGNGHFLSAASSLRRETMVGGSLTRASALRVGLGVGRAAVASGSRARPTHSCDRWVYDLWFGCGGRLIDFRVGT